MEYSTPELVVLGSASALVLGDQIGGDDNADSHVTMPPMGLALGLDD
ncbi:MAG TPA: hypothetical protein VHU82_00925 [Vicinamibacterales bacterium]|jgi:hypothetical protein|nr:hypothetical protein [Vicinamibacterales bacterium]